MAISGFSLRLVVWLILAAAGIKVLDMAFIELNARKVILPHFNVQLIPYHDPRVTSRNASLLSYQSPPRLIFTGDSRVKNGVNPEIIAQKLGVPAETFFNFGTGSQGLSFAREALVPHLAEIGLRPAYLVFGVTPDWLLNRESIRRLVDRYKNSWAYRMSHPNSSGGDRVETWLSFLLARHLALYRYRADLLNEEIIPALKCWFWGKCFVSLDSSRMRMREIKMRDGVQTRYGWSPQAWDGKTSGAFKSKARFDQSSSVDRENLIGLIHQVRQIGITPVFIRMPLHPSFWEAHKTAMPNIVAVLERVAKQEGADLIVPRGDYTNPELFVDGHHLSHRGAAYFSADIAPDLAPYLKQNASTITATRQP
ncbi:MAG: hypothetical protein L0338_38165 [Acidobacteria bacterium]|nr:hypothetical protein [Acidobacteriota bacterium]